MSIYRMVRQTPNSPSKSDTTTADERFNSTLLPHPKILQETIIYNGWRKLVNRRVQLPTPTNDDDKNIENCKQQQRVVDFEIVFQGDHGGTVSDEAVLMFVWNCSTQTAVLLFEYMPLIPQFLSRLAAGVVKRWNKSMLLLQMAPRMSKTRTTTTTTTMPQRQDLSVRMMHRILTPPRRVERGMSIVWREMDSIVYSHCGG